jgi:hypothetical protein
MKPGDRVKYSAYFLRNSGFCLGELPHATGEIIGLDVLSPQCTLARIKWDREGVPERVNICNLVLKDRIHLEAP